MLILDLIFKEGIRMVKFLSFRDDNVTTAHTVAKGTIGAITPIIGAIVSTVDQVESWLRILSLLLGCAVALVTIASLGLTVREKYLRINEPRRLPRKRELTSEDTP
jgi:hypothetical protein